MKNKKTTPYRPDLITFFRNKDGIIYRGLEEKSNQETLRKQISETYISNNIPDIDNSFRIEYEILMIENIMYHKGLNQLLTFNIQ